MKSLKLQLAGAAVSLLLLSGCTPEEQAFVAGMGVGAVGTALIYDYPYYYDRPYYYYGGHYYYGGYYQGGYYYHHGHRYHGGHYYHDGYRYYNGRRYRAQVGRYGYYQNRNQYKNRHRYRTPIHSQRGGRYGKEPLRSGNSYERERMTNHRSINRYEYADRSYSRHNTAAVRDVTGGSRSHITRYSGYRR